MPAERREQRQDEPPALAQLPEVELAARLEPDDEEEERHQAAVDPVPQVERDPVAAEVDREGRAPDALVRGRVDVRPHERGDRGREQDRGAAGLRAQELAQGRLDASRPGGAPGHGRGRNDCLAVRHLASNERAPPRGTACKARLTWTRPTCPPHDAVRNGSEDESGARPGPDTGERVARTEPGIAEAATARTAVRRRRRSLVCDGRPRLAMVGWHRPGRAGWVQFRLRQEARPR